MFEIAWGDDVPAWDIYEAHDLTVCHQCMNSSEELVDVVAATNGQSAGWYAYAEDSTGHREPGDFDCHWNIMGAGTNAEAMWEDPTGFGAGRLATQHWRAFGPAGGKANGTVRGVVFAEWDDTVGWTTADLGTPCWDAYEAFSTQFETVDNWTFSGDHESLECSDGSPVLTTVSWDDTEVHYEPWFACADGDADEATTQDLAGIGVITAMEAVAQDVALAVTEAPCVAADSDADGVADTQTCDTDGDVNTGGGLWFLYRPTGGAIQYLHIAADLDEIDPDDNAGTVCVENFADPDAMTPEYEFGEGLLLGPPMVQVDRDWFAEGTGTTDEHELRAFVATRSAACGLIEVRTLLQYDSTSDTWSVNGAPTFWEMDYDGDTTSSTANPTRSFASAGCKPFAGVDAASGYDRADELRGLELTTDGRWLLVYGGNAYTQGSATTPYMWSGGSTMGVCAIRVGDERVDPVTVGTQMWPETAASGNEPNPDPMCVAGYATCNQVAVPTMRSRRSRAR